MWEDAPTGGRSGRAGGKCFLVLSKDYYITKLADRYLTRDHPPPQFWAPQRLAEEKPTDDLTFKYPKAPSRLVSDIEWRHRKQSQAWPWPSEHGVSTVDLQTRNKKNKKGNRRGWAGLGSPFPLLTRSIFLPLNCIKSLQQQSASFCIFGPQPAIL